VRGVTCPGHRREERGRKVKRMERGKCPSFLGFCSKERGKRAMVSERKGGGMQMHVHQSPRF
jgi:hypothetical protein